MSKRWRFAHHPSLPGRRLTWAVRLVCIADFHCITGNPVQFYLTHRKRLVSESLEVFQVFHIQTPQLIQHPHLSSYDSAVAFQGSFQELVSYGTNDCYYPSVQTSSWRNWFHRDTAVFTGLLLGQLLCGLRLSVSFHYMATSRTVTLVANSSRFEFSPPNVPAPFAIARSISSFICIPLFRSIAVRSWKLPAGSGHSISSRHDNRTRQLGKVLLYRIDSRLLTLNIRPFTMSRHTLKLLTHYRIYKTNRLHLLPVNDPWIK